MKAWLWMIALLTNSIYAYYPYASQPQGAGKMAGNLLQPVAFASQLIYTSCFIIGSSFLFASIIKYMEYRRNPFAVPLSTVIFLFFAGLFLVGLPFAYLLINNQSPYSLFH